MTEPDVALTDYALAVLNGYFAVAVFCDRHLSNSFRTSLVVFFASIAMASVMGGTVHGFFLDESTWGFRILWPMTLIAIGVTAISICFMGLQVFSSHVHSRLIQRILIFVFLVYSATIIGGYQKFLIAIVFYLPAAVFFLVVLLARHIKMPKRGLAFAIVGLVFTFIAAGVQQLKLGIHPKFFNHNALYHVIQAVGLGFIFVGMRTFARMDSDAGQKTN